MAVSFRAAAHAPANPSPTHSLRARALFPPSAPENYVIGLENDSSNRFMEGNRSRVRLP